MAGVRLSSFLFLMVIVVLLGMLAQQLLAAEPAAVAQDVAPQGKLRIGLGAVKVLPSLKGQLTKSEQLDLVNRAAETIEGQMTDALHNTRKFEIVARQDLDELLKEQGLPGEGITDATDPKAAVPAKIKGVEYLVLTTIDDFVDVEQSTFSQEMQMGVSRRTTRMSAVVRIYNSTTGVLLESMAVPVDISNSGTSRATAGDAMKNSKAQDDGVYVDLINQLSMRCAQRVTDTLFPAKVVAVIGDTVTINRGAGTAVNRNEIWEVFVTGNELRDPDTGEVLGKEETKVGEVIIIDVMPKVSKARIYGENRGIAPGQTLRQKLQAPAGMPQPGAGVPAAIGPVAQ